MHNGPTLEVHLPAIARNYALLHLQMLGKGCAAVVKANAYGLGADRVAATLYDTGCRDFFVATLEEGLALRAHLHKHCTVYVFHGCRTKAEAKELHHHHLVPVLNDGGQIEAWDGAGACALHIDTGMRRLGLTPQDAATLGEEGRMPAHLQLILSHLACAGEPEHPLNAEQLAAFQAVKKLFPDMAASLCNSSGIFLGADYHFDLARPGCSLYGISPNGAQPNPVENVVTLSAPVLQYRQVKAGESVGYGATVQANEDTLLATVEFGYADGLKRILSNKTHGFAAGVRVPVIGCISMDMVSVDVSNVPEKDRTHDLRVTFIGAEQPVDRVAQEAGTIGYEIFTGLGSRVKRVYI